MRKMKIIVCMLVVGLMAFSLMACASKDDGGISEGDEGMAYREVEDEASGEVASAGDENQMQTVSGTITDASMNTVTIKTDDGVELTFSTEGAETAGSNGLETGSTATIIYTGEIDGTDTSGVVVNIVKQP